MIHRRIRSAAWWVAAIAMTAMAACFAYAVALQAGIEQLRTAAQYRLDVVAARLDGELARFGYLPSLLETAPEIFEMLDAPDDMALRQRVSRYLRAITATAGAENLYITHRSGLTLAAADWDQPGSPIGADLSFRPYVRDAMAQGRGRFFGVGFTTGRAGYYLAYALQDKGARRGVATVKVNLGAVERNWAQLSGRVLVVDARNVVILASSDHWKLHPLSPLSAAMRTEADEARTYGNADLEPLNWQVRARLDERTLRARLDDVDYVASERTVNDGLWRIVLLDDEAPVHVSARRSALSAALACAVLLLLIVALVQRRHAARLQQASRRALQAAHDGLEARVLERTAELRAVQNDLIHAGKLAALGQMSAGVVHELNQPLAAMRTLSDNAAVLLQKGRLADAQVNLERIANLTFRLARLTQQLKVFAHKASGPPRRVAVRNVVQDALLMGADRVRDLAISTVVEIEPETLSVLADEARLEQVLVNLVNNAIDAMAAVPERRLAIRAAPQGDRGVIAISDTGTGIQPDVLSHLFEPFITTKPAGKGLGLGLMISAHIVRELGGRLRARNLSPVGAEFVIELPIAPQPGEQSR